MIRRFCVPRVLAALTIVLFQVARFATASDATKPTNGEPAPAAAVAPFDAAQAKAHQETWGKYLGEPVQRKTTLGLVLVLIPPGEFFMGSSPAQGEFAVKWLARIPRIAPGEEERLRNEEQPQHRVNLSRPFWIGQTEVTIGQFRAFVDQTKYVTETERFGGGNSKKTDETDPVKRKAVWHSPGFPITDEHPVSQITWNDMLAFCNWLSEQDRLPVVYEKNAAGEWSRKPGTIGFRLPTEAEWEYACRAGTTTHYSFGDDVAQLDDHAWFNRTAEKNGKIGSRPVATKRANPFGLFDMHGNVWERCEDYFDPKWYRNSPATDPVGPPIGSNRMVRGGGWHYYDLHARCAYRNNYAPTARTASTGFRVVRSLAPAE